MVGNFILLIIIMIVLIMVGEALLGLLTVGVSLMALFFVVPLVIFIQVIGTIVFYNFITIFYLEARVIIESWKPAWASAPMEGWVLGAESDFEQLAERSRRSWIELVLMLLLSAALLVGGFYLLKDNMGSMLKLLPTSLTLGQGITSQSLTGNVGKAVVRNKVVVSKHDAHQEKIQLSANTFFAGKKPSLWIKVALDGHQELPAELGSRNMVSIFIDTVRSNQGNDLYDKGNAFESKNFCNYSAMPVTHSDRP